ncbi:MAG: MFS transporter [Pseudomonadales bacterium]
MQEETTAVVAQESQTEMRTVVAGVLMYMLAPLGMTLVPLLVGAAAKDLEFSDSQVGFLASADLLGIAAAAVSAPFWLHRISWRVAGVISITFVVLGNLLSSIVVAFEPLCVVRFVTELGSGGLFTLALVSLAKTQNPDRFFAIGIGMTIALSVVVFLWLPPVIDARGINVIYIVQGIVALTVLPFCAWLPPTGQQVEKRGLEDGQADSFKPLLICFIGFACVTMAEGGMWSYMERIGAGAGFSSGYVGKVLAITQVVSFISALVAAALSTRFGRTLPILGAILIFLGGLFLLLQQNTIAYMVAACLTQFAYIFVIPYLLLMCVELDPSGRFYVLTTAFKMGGFSAGPAVIALFLTGNGYAIVSWVGIAFLCVSLLLIIPLSLRLDRKSLSGTAAA